MSSDRRIDSFVSVAFVVYNDEANAPDYLRNIQVLLAGLYTDYEILVIAQRSTDCTVTRLRTLLPTIPGVRIIELGSRVSEDVAYAAALENAIGDSVVLIDPRFDPVAVIPRMVELCGSEADIVVGISRARPSLACVFVQPLIRLVLTSFGQSLSRSGTHLRCLSRRAVNAVIRAGLFHHALFLRMENVGYPIVEYRYNRLFPVGVVSLKSLVREAARLMIFGSTSPLRLIGVFSLTVSFALTVLSCSLALIHAARNDWNAAAMYGCFFVSGILSVALFSFLTFFAEYLARLLDHVGEHYTYQVAAEHCSTIIINEDRVNVSEDALARRDGNPKNR